MDGLIDILQLQRENFRSASLRYRLESTFYQAFVDEIFLPLQKYADTDKPLQPFTIDRVVDCRIKGAKYRVDVDTPVVDNGHRSDKERTRIFQVFNGTIAGTKEGRRAIVLEKTQPPVYLPFSAFRIWEEIQGYLENKDEYRASVSFDAEGRLELVLERPSVQWVVKAWFESESCRLQGMEVFHEGRLYERASNITYKEIPLSGRTGFFPLSIKREIYTPSGDPYETIEYVADGDSLKVNEEIPDEIFELKAAHDEWIYHEKLQMDLKVPEMKVPEMEAIMGENSIASEKVLPVEEAKDASESRPAFPLERKDKSAGAADKGKATPAPRPGIGLLPVVAAAIIAFLLGVGFARWGRKAER